MLKGYIFKEQTFPSEICALVFNEYLNRQDGIFNNYKNSMAVSYSGSNVTVASGAGIIQGRAVGEDSTTTLDAGTTAMFCKLVIEIDLDKTNTSSSFLQASYKVLKSASAYPSLTQNNIIGTNAGVYQYELARFKTGTNGITDFEDKRTYLDIPTIYEQLLAMVQAAIDSIEDGSAFALKTDIEGTTLYSNSTGSQNITLSESASNFEYIDIEYKNDSRYSVQRVYNANNKKISLTMSGEGGNSIRLCGAKLNISGTSITTEAGSSIAFYSNGNLAGYANNSQLYITKVIGYKY